MAKRPNDKNENATFDLNTYYDGGKSKPSALDVKKRRKQKIMKAVLVIFLIGVILVSMVVGGILVYAFGFVDATMDEDLNELKLNFTTTVYAKNSDGEWVDYRRLHGEENRIWVSTEKIPDNLKQAFISVEDKRFFEHSGVDWKRTTAALANYFLHFYSSNQGGSTITQQLVKNLTGDKDQSPDRKVREIMRARYLETNYSKETILECYLNVVAMGNGISGVQVAANYYYGKDVSELSLAECASIAAITQNPEGYRPDKNPQSNKERRDMILKLMYDQDVISESDYTNAVNEELNVVADSSIFSAAEVNNYFIDALIDEVIAGIAEKYGYDTDHAAQNFYNGGYKIYATVDPEIQDTVDSVFTDSEKYSLKARNGAFMQGAMTVMDYSGHIVGMSGGIGEKTTNRSFNRATSAVRQPGSTMKPVGAYCQAIENNLITYSTLINDTKTMYRNWYPVNWYHAYWGNITVHYALERSVNTIPVYLVNQLTPQKSYAFLKNTLNIQTLNSADADLSPLGMGGTNGGFTTTESAAAYAIFGNLGRYYKPTTYYYITDQYGNVILENGDKGIAAIGEDSATVMNHLLQNVVYGANGTGGGAAGYIRNMKIYAKTGTSDATKDLWFVGGSPYYVASCWCGYDNNETINSGVIAQRMWGAVMTEVHKDLPAAEFKESEYVSTRYYCANTGLLATSNCVHLAVGYYKNSYLPTCSLHGGNILSPIAGTNETPTGVSGVVKGEVTVQIDIEESSEESSSEEDGGEEDTETQDAIDVINNR